MPSISGSATIAGMDTGVVVLGSVTALNFIGAVVTTGPGGQMNVTVGGGGLFANTNLNNLTAPVQPNFDLDLQNAHKVINCQDPVAAQDVATKAYVDGSSPAGAWQTAGNAAGGVLGTTVAADTQFIFNSIEMARMTAGEFRFNTLRYKMLFATSSFLFGPGAELNQITAAGAGALAHGNIIANGQINATGDGSTASGVSDGAGSEIRAAGGVGCQAFGHATNAGTIFATANGALAFGRADVNTLLATGEGSFAGGFVDNTGPLQVLGVGAFGWGWGGTVIAGDRSVGFGQGILLPVYSCLAFGRFNENLGTSLAAWVDTDPLFVLGNGANAGARNNAFQVDKDGKLKTTAAHRDTAIRVVAAADNVSERTDRTIIFDTGGAGGNLSLPAGEEGLTYIFASKGAGGSTYTLVTPDAFDAGVTTVLGAGVQETIQFTGGTWYRIA